jgi:hypothetical protein
LSDFGCGCQLGKLTPSTLGTRERSTGFDRSTFGEVRLGGDSAQSTGAHAHNVTGMELSASPQLRLTVDGHLATGDQGLGTRSSRGSTGKLEYLAKATLCPF